MINDNQKLVSVTKDGYSVPMYDDSYGQLYVLRDSMSLLGVIRATTWETAYEIAEDKFFPEADESIEDLQRDYGPGGRDQNLWKGIPLQWHENPLFVESYGFRPNGPNKKDKRNHGIYAKDLNGDYLEALTPALCHELSLVVTVEDIVCSLCGASIE